MQCDECGGQHSTVVLTPKCHDAPVGLTYTEPHKPGDMGRLEVFCSVCSKRVAVLEVNPVSNEPVVAASVN